MHAYVSWFGTFHQLTVPGFIYGCMAQFPVDTQLSATKLQIYCKFSRYIMLAKES